MDIFFKRAKLAKVLNSAALMRRKYRVDSARRIQIRLAVLVAATSLADVPKLPPDRCHRLKGGDYRGSFAVDAIHPHRIVFDPEPKPSNKKRMGLNLHKITTITIVEIVDYH